MRSPPSSATAHLPRQSLSASGNSASGGSLSGRLGHKSGRPHFVSPLPTSLAAATLPINAGTSSALVTVPAAAATSPAAAATAPAGKKARARPPLITPAQRAALQVSAFGFRSHPHRHAEEATEADAGNGAATATAGGLASSKAAAAARNAKKAAMHTKASDDPTAPVVVIGPERDSAAFRLCCEALAEGCVQTYAHLFHLAHRDPVCVDALSHTYFSVAPDRLAWVQQQLSAVEVLRRQSEFTQVLTHCQQLADYFEGERDIAEATWYYETALQYMMESLDRTLEQQARLAYAAFAERHGRLEEAAELYEAMYRLAVALRDANGVKEASHCLVRVFQGLGDALKYSDPEAAAKYFAKSATAAERGKSAVEECAAYSALGDVSEARGDLKRALMYQRNYRAVARRNELKPQECHATLRVADLEERLGLKLEASATLQEALLLAKELGEPRQLCNATMQLGEAYRSRGQDEEALQCFDESFAAAVKTGDRELIDKVRMAIGFARGDYSLTHAYHGEGYLQLICTDIRAQLAWMSSGTL